MRSNAPLKLFSKVQSYYNLQLVYLHILQTLTPSKLLTGYCLLNEIVSIIPKSYIKLTEQCCFRRLIVKPAVGWVASEKQNKTKNNTQILTTMTTYFDNVIDAPDEREEEEDNQAARVIVFGLLHLGQVKSLCCTLTHIHAYKKIHHKSM